MTARPQTELKKETVPQEDTQRAAATRAMLLVAAIRSPRRELLQKEIHCCIAATD